MVTANRYKSKNYDLNNYQKIKSIVNYLEIPFIDIHEEVFEKEENPLKLFPFEVRIYSFYFTNH